MKDRPARIPNHTNWVRWSDIANAAKVLRAAGVEFKVPPDQGKGSMHSLAAMINGNPKIKKVKLGTGQSAPAFYCTKMN
jgi:hypothetical protein